GCVTFSSAAACALGRYALPVYEVYKVGFAPQWLEGLDILGEVGVDGAVIPHFNNAEGGTHDTRFCYMGERRLRLLESMLDEGAASPCPSTRCAPAVRRWRRRASTPSAAPLPRRRRSPRRARATPSSTASRSGGGRSRRRSRRATSSPPWPPCSPSTATSGTGRATPSTPTPWTGRARVSAPCWCSSATSPAPV